MTTATPMFPPGRLQPDPRVRPSAPEPTEGVHEHVGPLLDAHDRTRGGLGA